MNILGNIVTARAALLSLVLAVLPLLSMFGVHLPDGLPGALTKVFEALFTVIGLLVSMVHLENKPQPVKRPKRPGPPKPPDSGGVKPVVISGLIVILCGCSGSLESARPPVAPTVDRTECNSIDRAHAAWSGVGKSASVLSGAGGLTAIPIEDKGARIGILVSSVVLEAFGMFSFVESEAFGNEWAAQCSTKAAP